MKISILCTLALLTGCASLQTQWQGKTSEMLVSQRGVPSGRMAIADGEIWQYVDQCGNVGLITMENTGLMSSSLASCRQQIFKIKNGIVVDAKESWK